MHHSQSGPNQRKAYVGYGDSKARGKKTEDYESKQKDGYGSPLHVFGMTPAR